MEHPHFKLYSFEGAIAEFNSFLDVYYPIKTMIPPDAQISNLKEPTLRTCHYCQRSYPEVSFMKDAHIIPESLGNKYLVSDFECDTCNELFSKFETAFSGWLGIIKTLTGTKGKNGIPKFKPFNETVVAHKVSFLNSPATKISTGAATQGKITLEKSSGEVTFKFNKDGYIPIRAYKSLLKIALSMISPEERVQYSQVFHFLLGPDNQPIFQLFAKVICHVVPMTHAVIKPFGCLYQKMDPLSKHPLHFFLLYFEHFIYGFPLPLNQADIDQGCYANNTIQALYPPPILLWKPEKESAFYSHMEDFSSDEKKRNEEQVITFNLLPEALKNLTATDPKTGEFKSAELIEEEIATILILSEQVTIQKGQQFEVP